MKTAKLIPKQVRFCLSTQSNFDPQNQKFKTTKMNGNLPNLVPLWKIYKSQAFESKSRVKIHQFWQEQVHSYVDSSSGPDCVYLFIFTCNIGQKV